MRFSSFMFIFFFFFKEIYTRRTDHDARCLNRSRSHRARFYSTTLAYPCFGLFLKKAIDAKFSKRVGLRGEIFARRDERNRLLLFAIRIETIPFRLIKNQYVFFFSQRVIYVSVIFEQSKHEWYKPIRNNSNRSPI